MALGNKEHQAFQAVKRIISKETLLAYPDFSKPFVIHTDVSHTQLGAVISQNDKPITFYSWKLKPKQTRYTTTERELLSIVETLKEFRNILLGHKIVVHMDHKNLTCKHFNTERIMQWRLILEGYSPKLKYIKGEHNIVTDALSRLNLDTNELSGEQMSNEQLAEVYVEDENDFPTDYPLSYWQIEFEQGWDNDLQELYARRDLYERKTFKHLDRSFELIMREGKIVLPKSLQDKAVHWYHDTLMHPGKTHTELMIGQHFYWKGMCQSIHRLCGRCHTCQLTKPKHQKFGHLPPKKA